MTVKIHFNPKENGTKWANILFRLRVLWENKISTILFSGERWRRK